MKTNETGASDREVITTRIFDAPIERVWESWSNPEHLKNWWGPQGFSNTIHVFEFVPDGSWEVTMHGPDGTNYPNFLQFVEIVPHKRLVFDHLRPMHWFRVIASFEKLANKTAVSFHMIFETAEEWEKVKLYVPKANEENFDRLEAHLKDYSGNRLS